MTIARHVQVTGRVQGVFFRAWTKNEADRLGISGWVLNRADGSVEAHLEGDHDSVDQLIGLLKRGPTGARVEGLQIHEAPVEKACGFSVRR